jgi:hypothetical protein
LLLRQLSTMKPVRKRTLAVATGQDDHTSHRTLRRKEDLSAGILHDEAFSYFERLPFVIESERHAKPPQSPGSVERAHETRFKFRCTT